MACCGDPDPTREEVYSDDPTEFYAYGVCRNCGTKVESIFELKEVNPRE